MVHNAGKLNIQRIENTDYTELEKLFAVNVLSVFMLTKMCLESVRKQKGRIISISSGAAIKQGEYIFNIKEFSYFSSNWLVCILCKQSSIKSIQCMSRKRRTQCDCCCLKTRYRNIPVK